MSFDIDAWLTDARPPQRAVTIYGRGDLVSQLQELETVAAQAAAHAIPGDDRLGGDPTHADAADLRAQLEASRLTIHVRGLIQEERTQLVTQCTPAAADGEAEPTVDGEQFWRRALVICAVQPTFTYEQADRLAGAIGSSQWLSVVDTIRRAEDEPIDIPLSRIGLEITQDS